MNTARIFDIAFRSLLVFLPFSTFISVFFSQVLHIPGISFLKEIFIILMGACLLWEYWQGRLQYTRTRYDLLIGTYIGWMLLVSVLTTGIYGIVYGGRYDFSFLILFFILFHGFSLLGYPLSYYIRIFLISGGIALFLSMLLKWPLSEDLLLHFGYSSSPSQWQFGGAVPIFHGVEGANVRRFQGIFDGPNTMGAFLLLYIGVFLYYFRHLKQWYFVLGVISVGFITCIIYTYSRSALLGAIGGLVIIFFASFRYLFHHYRKQMIALIILFFCGIGAILLQYGGNLQAIIERGGSSKGHAERMIIGLHRIKENPFGQGLGSAGPAYRHVQNLEGKDRSEIEEIDRYHIPESWYIQQGIEGGVIGGILFILIISYLFFALYRVHIILAGMFFSLLIMNFFLHTFESSLIALSLFGLLGCILASHHTRYTYVSR